MELPLDRLRIKVRRKGQGYATEEYSIDSLPEQHSVNRYKNAGGIRYSLECLPERLKPYVEKALEDLRNSDNPTCSRTYNMGEDKVYVWYKPKWHTELIECLVPEVFQSRLKTPKVHTKWVKIRKWP